MRLRTLIIIAFIWLASGCRDRRDLGEVTVGGQPLKKKQYKTHEQFIQIAYIDLFNQTIEPQKLSSAKHIFDSQGDDDINYGLFVRELIKQAVDRIIPDNVMRQEPEKFVEQSYLRFFGRYPNGYEQKILVDAIRQDKSLTTAKVYYILMTTKEYRMF